MSAYRSVALSVMLVLPAIGAGADAPGEQGLEEIVVTAQRRTERLQDVPISVLAMSQTTMDAQGTRSIDDVARLSPGISFTRGTVNNNFESSNISIRGIDSAAGAATTGLYIDDTPIQSRHLSFGTFSAYPALFDVERVEVLRGPQGTLFGAGSEGGTLRFITPEPDLKRSSLYLRAEGAGTQHGDPIYEAGVAGGAPIIDDRLAFRASVSVRHEGGYIDRYDWRTSTLLDKRANSNKTLTARLALKWAISDRLSVTPSIYYQKRTIDGSSAYWSIAPGSAETANGLFFGSFRSGAEVAGTGEDHFTVSALKIEWDLGAAQLVSNTSYYDRSQSGYSDYTQFDRSIFLGSPFFDTGDNIAPTQWGDQQKNFAQEVRLQSTDSASRFNWTFGAFFQRARENTVENVYDPSLLTFFGVPGSDGYIYRQDPFNSVDRQLAVYANADFRVTDRLKLIAGLRVSKVEYEGVAQYSGFVLFGPPVNSTGSITEHPVTPRFGAEFRVTPDNLLYLTIAKGFRIGGANPKVGTTCINDLTNYGLSDVPDKYNSDSLWSYEVGSKNQFADRRVLLNASAFLIKWKDIQQNVPLINCGFQFTSNLGEMRSTGFDIQTEIRPADVFSAGATFAYTLAKYTKTAFATPVAAASGTALPVVSDGDRLGGSPWTLALFSQVDFPVMAHEGYARIDYQYGAGLYHFTPAQNPADGGNPDVVFNTPANSYASLRAGVKWGGWDVSLFSQNLFNSQPKLSRQLDGVPGASPLFLTGTFRPRTIGVTALYRY